MLCAPQTACLKALWADRVMWYAKLRFVYLQVFWISVGRIGPHPAVSLAVRGQPAVLKLPAVPACASTMKNVHALSIRHLVFGIKQQRPPRLSGSATSFPDRTSTIGDTLVIVHLRPALVTPHHCTPAMHRAARRSDAMRELSRRNAHIVARLEMQCTHEVVTVHVVHNLKANWGLWYLRTLIN